MSVIFGGARPQQSNSIKSYQREINKHVRQMERESTKCLSNERLIIREIKKNAEKNDMHIAKLKAKELIRARMFRRRIVVTQQSLSTLSQELAMIHTSQHSQEILAKTTCILQQLNKKMDISSTYRMLMEFEKQSMAMTEKQEILNDTMDNMMELDDSEVDSTLASVFEELGLQFSNDLKSAQASTTKELDLETRFAQLVANR